MNKLLLIGACGLVLGVAGCGSDDESSDTGAADTGTGGAGASAPSKAPIPAGGNVKVVMKDVKDTPQDVTVKKGGTIEWLNEDPFDHTVTKEGGPGGDFDSGNVSSQEVYTHKFTTAGTINYHCTIHPNQTGKITVK